jgi:hypothetical protein
MKKHLCIGGKGDGKWITCDAPTYSLAISPLMSTPSSIHEMANEALTLEVELYRREVIRFPDDCTENVYVVVGMSIHRAFMLLLAGYRGTR